jgi:formate dehydrogenase major subunit
MTNSITEIGSAACIFAVGTNTTWAHPIIGLQVKKAVREGATLIVANPKKIDLCRFSHIFIQHRAGTDLPLLMGMMRVIADEGRLDTAFIKDRCENFEAFQESLRNFDLDSVEQVTGVPKEKIAEAARTYATKTPATILYVQGACDMGALPNVYPGYQKVDAPGVKGTFETAWGGPLSDAPGRTHTEILDAVYENKIKALYLVGENPILTEANAHHAEDALARAEFLVVQDLFLSETARHAHVVLPAATFAEKDGTFTNTERRVQRVRKAIEPPGAAKTDLWIIGQIAKRLGGKGFDFSHPSAVMEETASLTPSYRGISYERLENGGLQWPCVTREHPGTPILHTERFATKKGKGRFMPLAYRAPNEVPDDQYPLLLTTDRSLYHFHSTMTRRAEGLDDLDGQEWLMLNPKDATKLGIADGEAVRVASRRGEVEVRTKIADICLPGMVSMTFHFAESPTNVLTNSALDPVAKIPETKVCAVRIEKLEK